MSYQGNNPEGYPDPTANQAVGIVSREEKEAAKAKKRATREYDIRAAMKAIRAIAGAYGHGEKSVMMASEFIHLTMEERYAIRWHMGMSEANIIQTYCQAAEKYPLVLFTHMADQMATSYLETNTGNKKPQKQSLSNRRAAMNTERDDREQIEAIRKMMAEKEEKKRAREIRKRLRRKRIHAFFHGKKADKH